MVRSESRTESQGGPEIAYATLAASEVGDDSGARGFGDSSEPPGDFRG